jgi:hypothetical protein
MKKPGITGPPWSLSLAVSLGITESLGLKILVSTVQFRPGCPPLLLFFRFALNFFSPLAIFFFKDFVIGRITMNRSRSGLRCRALCNIITSKGLLPRNTEGVFRSEGRHLGRPVIFADWGNGMKVPVPPHEIAVLELPATVLDAA